MRPTVGTDSAETYVHGELRCAVDVAQAMSVDAALHAEVVAAVEAIAGAIGGGRKLLLAGNGGSAADAQHLAAELVGRFAYDRPGIPAIALTTDTSALTAISNDYGFERVFARQVEALGGPGDVLIALSTSGRSPNILAALEAARARGMVTIGLGGRTGGAMAPLCDHLLRVPADTSPHIQQGHITLGHIVCGLVERAVRPPG